MIFQDAMSSLNPRAKIRDVVAEPLVVRWLESHKRSGWVRAWEQYVPRMVRFWRQPWIRKVIVPIIGAFFLGMIVRVVSTALGSEGADGVRDGGAGETAGNVLMIVALIAAAPFVAALVISG